jgi:hypothetical protein
VAYYSFVPLFTSPFFFPVISYTPLSLSLQLLSLIRQTIQLHFFPSYGTQFRKHLCKYVDTAYFHRNVRTTGSSWGISLYVLCMYVCVCMYVFMYVCIMYACICLYVLCIYVCVCMYVWMYVMCVCMYVYTECPRRNVPDFGRMFLKLKYTDLTKNTYIRSWTVAEIMAREKCGFLAVPCTVPVSRDVLPVHCACPSFSLQQAQARSRCDCSCKVLGTLRTTATLVRVFM